ncbi:MAG: hypothetical protein IJ597_03580 [Synergistaceae bacterium]|nr:hypothetical protein [Synergistaceae bacterium]
MSNSSSGRRKKTAIQVAKTIIEANQIASNYGLAEYVEFEGLDIKAANDIIESLKKTKDEFPDSFNLNFVGSFEGFNKHYQGKTYLTDVDDVSAVYATVYLNGVKHKAILLSDKHFNSKNYHSTLKNKEAMCDSSFTFYPVGCGTVKATVDHEMGHAIDDKFKISEKSQFIKNLYSKYYKPTHSKKHMAINVKMANVLSGYANTNIEEFVAEAWSEYRNNPKPREIAKSVGNEIIKYMKEARKESKKK